MLIDVTAEAHNRALQGSLPAHWAAHIHSDKVRKFPSAWPLVCSSAMKHKSPFAVRSDCTEYRAISLQG